MAKKVIIIGAGIAGLSAGIHARANGFDAKIFESHDLPGGLCTSWRRGDYLIDGCVHWLCGSSGRGLLGKYLAEVGILGGRSFIDRDELSRIEVGPAEDRKWFIAYTNPARLNAHLKELSPQDAAEIDRFTSLIEKFTRFPSSSDKPVELWGFSDMISLMKSMKPFMKEYREFGKMSIEGYASRFTGAHVREGLSSILAMENFSFFALLMMLAWHSEKNAGYPLGGSLALARDVERKFLSNGGIVNYRKRVTEILVESGRAVGVRLEDGSEHKGDYVVSCADGETTIYSMLKGRYRNGKIDAIYRDTPLFNSLFCMSLGVKRDLSSLPHLAVHCLRESIAFEGVMVDKIGIKHYCDDPAMAPLGKSVVQVMYASDYGHWKALAQEPALYRAEKEAVAKRLIGALEEFLPGIARDCEMIDAATPVTWKRYTGNKDGTSEGWFINPRTMTLRVPKTLPGLKGFFMAGQWVQPGGGIATAVKSGRDAVWRIAACEKKEFVPAH
jgi:phytoene dehydrogenase-like protein